MSPKATARATLEDMRNLLCIFYPPLLTRGGVWDQQAGPLLGRKARRHPMAKAGAQRPSTLQAVGFYKCIYRYACKIIVDLLVRPLF